MIITAFLNILAFILQLIISVFPNGGGLPQEVHNGAILVGGYFGTFDSLLPIATLLSVLTILIGVELLIWGFRTFKWLISHLPMIGGRG